MTWNQIRRHVHDFLTYSRTLWCEITRGHTPEVLHRTLGVDFQCKHCKSRDAEVIRAVRAAYAERTKHPDSIWMD